MAIVFNRGSLAPIVGLAKEAGAASRRKEDRARAERQVSQGQRDRAATLRAREARRFQREQLELRRQQSVEDRDIALDVASERFRAELAIKAEERAQKTAETERKEKLKSLGELAKIDIDAQKKLVAYEQDKDFEIFKTKLKRENDLISEEAKRAKDTLEFQIGLKGIRKAQDTGFYTGPVAKRKMDRALLKWAQEFSQLPEAASLLGLGVEAPAFSEQLRETIAASRLPEAREDLAQDNPAAVGLLSDTRVDSLLTQQPPTEEAAQEILDTLVSQGRREEHQAYLQRWGHLFK